MNKCKSIVIDGTEYRPINEDTRPDANEAFRIVIADNRGLTFAGFVALDGESEWVTIRDARCVIRWGTSKHLAELAASGPRPNTILGDVRTVRVRRANIVAVYDCAAVWK